MNLQPTTFAWFARHEFTLAWRDFTALMTGGKRRRAVIAFIIFAVLAVGAHLLAKTLIAPNGISTLGQNKASFVMLTGSGILFFTVMLSQAMEAVTRAYYARSDLDLILSSPTSIRQVFAIRSLGITTTTFTLSCLLAGPALNVLIVIDRPGWLAGYVVLAALSAIATAISIGITLGLFHLFGPKRTRVIAQVLAAIVGAGFLIGIQVVAILSFGQYSRFSVLQSDGLVTMAPALNSLFWLPAKAAMGDPFALSLISIFGFGLLALVMAISSASFGRHAIAAAGVSATKKTNRHTTRGFHTTSQKQALRRKEWKLLLRDPWLLSQTLMQILYLLPPALLLWLNYGQDIGMFVVVVPVIVMGSGQLAGGLAWLAISGEDAHDLVATAPIGPRTVLIAKIQAILGVIAVVIFPFIVAIAINSAWAALVVVVGIVLSASSATAIQLWFKAQAKRSMFRRRQVSSRVATLSEAFASIMWAGTAAIAVTQSWLAIGPAVIAILVLLIAYMLRPKSESA